MKKREIDVWVNKDQCLKGTVSYTYPASYESSINKDNFVKAKLIIEIPEPKKEFTPSDIRDAVTKHCNSGQGVEYERAKVVQELFGEDHQ